MEVTETETETGRLCYYTKEIDGDDKNLSGLSELVVIIRLDWLVTVISLGQVQGRIHGKVVG